MNQAFKKYVQDTYPKIWQGWETMDLSPNEVWLLDVAEKAFAAGVLEGERGLLELKWPHKGDSNGP